MILSSNRCVKVDSHTYRYNSLFSIRACSGLFYILYKKNPVKWASGFASVKCAEDFLNSHDMSKADGDSIPYSADDFAYLIEAYGFTKKGDVYFTKVANEDEETAIFLKLEDDGRIVVTSTSGDESSSEVFTNLDDAIVAVDRFFGDDSVFSSVSIIEKTARESVTCAVNVRDLAKNLVRVKSSNIWAYGMNIRERKDKTGDVVVQFKGSQGGPEDIYLYIDVPVVLWRKWLTAPSKGHFFWRYIRNNFYYRKLTGDRRGKLKNAIN